MIFSYGIPFLILGFLALLQFKSIFLKLILLIFLYPLITMYLFCIEVPLGGSIDYIGRTVYESFSKEAFSYAIIGYFTFVAVIWSLRKKYFSFNRIEFSETLRAFISIVLVIVSILAYPKAFGIGSERWNLIAGPWLVISIALNAILIVSFQKFKSVASVLQILLAVLLLVGGERVNSLVVFLMFFMLYGSQGLERVKEKKVGVAFVLAATIIVILGVGAHYWRNGDELNAILLYKNIISSATVGDVTHVYFTSFSYLNDYGIDLRPVLNEIGSMFYIPKIGGTGNQVAYNFTEILRNHAHNAGGGLFYSEGVLVFGKIGVLIYACVYGAIVRFLFNNKHSIVTLTSIIFFILQFRIQWYGIMYVYMPIWFGIVALKFFEIIKNRENTIELIE
tara:strand:+ start:759 stop:1937 length:1179 start_codon:yes stop_codon:yes gene_type:complete